MPGVPASTVAGVSETVEGEAQGARAGAAACASSAVEAPSPRVRGVRRARLPAVHDPAAAGRGDRLPSQPVRSLLGVSALRVRSHLAERCAEASGGGALEAGRSENRRSSAFGPRPRDTGCQPLTQSSTSNRPYPGETVGAAPAQKELLIDQRDRAGFASSPSPRGVAGRRSGRAGRLDTPFEGLRRSVTPVLAATRDHSSNGMRRKASATPGSNCEARPLATVSAASCHDRASWYGHAMSPTSEAPSSGWRRIVIRSSSASGAGLSRIRSGIPILPTSWRRAPWARFARKLGSRSAISSASSRA